MRAAADLARLQRAVMRRLTYAGLALSALGVAWWLLAGYVDLLVVYEALGRGAVGAAAAAGALVLLPFTFSLAPLYAGVTLGDWMPLVFSTAGSSLLALLGRYLP